ncbi:MAG: hypothetical protein ABJC26_05785, partial [Gemmatimonadaceae bacterium]
MKFISRCFLMALSVVVATEFANAQTPPARPPQPVRPAPAPMPAPAPRPARVITPDDPDYSMYYNRAMDAIDSKNFINLNDLKINLDDLKFNMNFDKTLSSDMQMRIEDARRMAMDGQRAAMDASRDAMREATRALNGRSIAQAMEPLARINGDEIAQQVREATQAARLFAPMAPMTSLTPRWTQEWTQDRDPADSIFGSARDALNRGDYRRSADLFAQVYTKFPKSNRLPEAAYYEAFARYRIGTTEELKAGLRVLNERGGASMGGSNSVNVTTNVGVGGLYSRAYVESMSGVRSANSNEVRALAARINGVLAQRGDAEAMKVIQAAAQKGSNCDSEDMQVRAEALSALAQSDMAAATPTLRRVLEKKDPCTLELRRRALSILLRRADTAATSAAISVAKNADETIDLRTDAISYLARLPGDNAMTALEDLLRSSTDRDIQRSAVRALSNTDNPKARQSIRALIERSDVNEDLRAEAISTMERDRGANSDDATYLRGLFPKLQAERLKIAALAAISKTPGAENEQFILALARNTGESSAVRSSAVSRMYRMPAISIAEIGKLYDTA